MDATQTAAPTTLVAGMPAGARHIVTAYEMLANCWWVTAACGRVVTSAVAPAAGAPTCRACQRAA